MCSFLCSVLLFMRKECVGEWFTSAHFFRSIGQQMSHLRVSWHRNCRRFHAKLLGKSYSQCLTNHSSCVKFNQDENEMDKLQRTTTQPHLASRHQPHEQAKPLYGMDHFSLCRCKSCARICFDSPNLFRINRLTKLHL